jgi:hypothetical protein
MENMIQTISGLAQQIVFYSLLNSVVTYGLLMTVKSMVAKSHQDPADVVISKWIGTGITYGLGIVMGFIINHHKWYVDVVYGLCIGACSVAMYKSAVQSFLNLIPSLFNKIFGSSNPPAGDKP